MNAIVRKAILSFITGAACTAGSWLAKETLNETKKAIKTQQEKKCKEETSPA